jgi:FKBP-type peptidyl-prolyl cis-trans isomerase 2
MANEPSNIPLVVLIVLVLVGASIGIGYFYYKAQPATPASPTLVALGDNLTVTYIGVMGSGPETGKVFDTSVYQVATNNATWPKTIEFGWRGSKAAYSQFGVHVGPLSTANVTLNNYSFSQVVPGFWEGLIGAPTNVTQTVVVPPSLGYAAYPCDLVQPLTFHLPVYQTVLGTEFQRLYPGVSATTGSTFTDPHYGWPVDILSANASYVTLENIPTVGAVSYPSGWGVTVENVTSTSNGTGLITMVNDLQPSQAGLVQGNSTVGFSCAGSSVSRYIVTNVNLANGTYTEDFNTEVAGQTLIFLIKVINLFTPAVNDTVSA